MPSDPREWIAVSLLPGMGPVTLGRLFQQNCKPSDLFSRSPPLGVTLRSDTRAALACLETRRRLRLKACELYDWAESEGITILTLDADDYPPLLASIYDPPPLLWVKGDASVLTQPQIAMVGSRHASRGGLRSAYDFSSYLSRCGLVVTSGLALGIDSEAHRGAVEQKLPTIAVMGTSIEHVYPRRNRGLAEQIVAQGGCLISELPPGSPPLAAHFPRRNRIISGLSVGTLVVEAALKSGSLITAREALEQGREVFAIPGAIANPLSRGCHALIREGAVLVENARHIIEQLGALLGSLLPPEERERDGLISSDSASQGLAASDTLPSSQAKLLQQIPYELIDMDQLSALAGGDFSQLQQGVMQLQLSGWIEAVGSGVRRCR
ncbi:DNA-processing protein DprA [Nitrincola alkalilacustris]|uniref:DNA-processing protein DprA n=1 Tax=Nitrincola alkalilacustris TaxID=1571224 RepID=UPI00124F22E3|nr:DNA-processing protein DprA [Nitrincola alkalilacustris]